MARPASAQLPCSGSLTLVGEGEVDNPAWRSSVRVNNPACELRITSPAWKINGTSPAWRLWVATLGELLVTYPEVTILFVQGSPPMTFTEVTNS